MTGRAVAKPMATRYLFTENAWAFHVHIILRDCDSVSYHWRQVVCPAWEQQVMRDSTFWESLDL